MEAAEPSRGSVYDGFISYSHAADGLLAPRLQAGLQRFAKPWWQRRALRVFRDESSLSANPHLWSSITQALDTSGWFVLLLSPDAAQSEWVNQEVAYWVEHKDPARIIPVVTSGEFGWDGSDVRGDCVPPALRGSFPDEPRWVDARDLGDPETLDLQNPEFAAVVADLAAPLRGVPKEDLASEEVRQHKRTVRTAWAAGAALVALSLAAVTFGFQSARNAEEAERQTVVAEQAARRAEEQSEIARQALVDVEEEAARADRTATRLIEYLIRPEDPQGRGGFVEVPSGAQPLAVPPANLPEIAAPPASPRLDFLQETCVGDVCLKAPAFIRDDPPSRTRYDLSDGTLWLAGEPFHVRHGFSGAAAEDVERVLAIGYSVHAFLTRVAGPEGGRFDLDRPYRLDADSIVEITDDTCGPVTYPVADRSTCAQWVIDFPEGLPAGAYEFGLEWTAPCANWFETDVCPLPTKPIGLQFVGGIVSFLAEDYRGYGDNELDWPVDPWSRSEPIPEDGG